MRGANKAAGTNRVSFLFRPSTFLCYFIYQPCLPGKARLIRVIRSDAMEEEEGEAEEEEEWVSGGRHGINQIRCQPHCSVYQQ